VNENADKVEQFIREAFANVQCPDRFVKKRNSDVDDMERELKGKPWQLLTIGELMRHRAALGMVDADAFRFFVAAYLVVSLDQTRPEYIEDLREATLFALGPYLKSPGSDPIREKLLHARIATLDDRQREAIRRYIRFVRAQSAHPKNFSALDLNGMWLAPDHK
jgi:hypothetical protein